MNKTVRQKEAGHDCKESKCEGDGEVKLERGEGKKASSKKREGQERNQKGE